MLCGWEGNPGIMLMSSTHIGYDVAMHYRLSCITHCVLEACMSEISSVLTQLGSGSQSLGLFSLFLLIVLYVEVYESL